MTGVTPRFRGGRITADDVRRAAQADAEAEAEVAARTASARRAEERAAELRRLNQQVNVEQTGDLDTDLDDDDEDEDDDADEEDDDPGDPGLMGADQQSVWLRARVPDSPIPLRPGELACCGCGAPTAAPPPDQQASLVYARLMAMPTPSSATYVADRIALTRCSSCAAHRDLAYRILAAHPGLQVKLGGVAPDLLEHALGCLAACDTAPPAPDAPPAVIGALVRLAGPGRGLRWQGMEFRRIKDRCAPRPWASVPVSDRRRAARATMEYLAACVRATAPDRTVPCPPAPNLPGNVAVSSGCLLCGTPSIRASADRIAKAEQTGTVLWAEHPRVLATSLGAHVPGTVRVSGHLCPTCENVYQHELAWGPSIREAACAVYQRQVGREDRAAMLRGQEVTPIAWGGLVADRAHRGQALRVLPDRPWSWVAWPAEKEADEITRAMNVLSRAGLLE